MTAETINHFVELSKINVNGKTEKKGTGKNAFTYLSWAYAVEELMKADGNANWVIHEPKSYQVPQGLQYMVSCTVTAFGKSVYMWLPVMNHSNQAITNPTVNDINKAQMRCLVKAIACHGLGLYIYAGEDLPLDDEPQQPSYQNQNYQQPSYQQPKETLTPERFSGAIEAIKAGKFTKQALLGGYDLTPDQQSEVHALAEVA